MTITRTFDNFFINRKPMTAHINPGLDIMVAMFGAARVLAY